MKVDVVVKEPVRATCQRVRGGQIGDCLPNDAVLNIGIIKANPGGCPVCHFATGSCSLQQCQELLFDLFAGRSRITRNLITTFQRNGPPGVVAADDGAVTQSSSCFEAEQKCEHPRPPLCADRPLRSSLTNHPKLSGERSLSAPSRWSPEPDCATKNLSTT